ncbi:hypothetical protein ENUP19_0063G0034 [Entamoeba nuttalli]|uniref:Rho guanine nucleotide exchange factor, putative n=2 Tax=Entamoeba nuttalli TaxID=412467 RepID=K2GWE2_ENTNP|nr:Rho guanine nucleotide exchange factor, putative [Entamoeba nuttalli P19]EKE38107.1 Rho guanine nucleotide exchange factor, putative [Entamoeba nuttalli P19]|eukprot:XP_008859548.1 Rho guanine nucleotide exchange factor, putative [Entamoeba nuttalli P19]
MEQRKKVVNELATTEKTYSDMLQLAINVYFQPIQKSNILDKNDFEQLFCNIETVAMNSMLLCYDLQKRAANFEQHDIICDVLLFRKTLFDCYNEYIRNYDRAIERYGKLLNKKKFQEMSNPNDKCSLGLEGLLITPVQRIPRYVLLMKEYMKCTPKEHPDYLNAEIALNIFQQLANEINLTMADEQNRQRLQKIVMRFSSLPINVSSYILDQPHLLLLEGTLNKYCRKGIKKRVCFLFSDQVLIYGSPVVGSQLSYHNTIKLIAFKSIKDTDKKTNVIQLIGKEKAFNLSAESLQIKKEWLNQLCFALTGEQKTEFIDVDDEGNEEDTTVIMMNEEEVSECMKCKVHFNLTTRKHHCNYCGKVFCDKCLSYRIVLPKQLQESKVCIDCYDKIKKIEPPLPSIPPPRRKTPFIQNATQFKKREPPRMRKCGQFLVRTPSVKNFGDNGLDLVQN